MRMRFGRVPSAVGARKLDAVKLLMEFEDVLTNQAVVIDNVHSQSNVIII